MRTSPVAPDSWSDWATANSASSSSAVAGPDRLAAMVPSADKRWFEGARLDLAAKGS